MWTLPELLAQMEEKKTYILNPDENQVMTREQVGEMLSTHFEDAIEVINNGLLFRALTSCDAEMADQFASYQRDLLPPEEILFYLQYDLNHDLPFSYQQCIFREVKSLGEKILTSNAEQEILIEAMKRKLFRHYFKIKGLDQANPEMYEGVLICESLVHHEEVIAYYTLGYFLSEQKYYVYRSRKMATIVDLYHYLSKRNLFLSFSNTMEHDWLFFGWLYYQGKQDVVEKWRVSLLTFDQEETQVTKQG